MSSKEPTSRGTLPGEQNIIDGGAVATQPSPARAAKRGAGLSPFWQERLIELGMILSMALYYVVGNPNLPYTSSLARINPLLSLPFLAVFIVLCWFRLPFALALLPLTLPYYLLPKTVVPSVNFSLAEITLVVCAGVAAIQVILFQTTWRYWRSPRAILHDMGPFAVPIIVFVAAALLSLLVAYDRHVALRGLREFIIEPLFYFLLLLYCFRSWKDLLRLFAAFLLSALIVGILGIIQYLFFRYTLKPDVDGMVRIAAVYGSANDLGILFDFTLPFAMALVIIDTSSVFGATLARWLRIMAVVYCLFALLIFYLIQSLGTWLAMGVAVVFLAALSIRNRRTLLVSVAVFVVIVLVAAAVFHTKIINFVFSHHVNAAGVSTTQKRIYLWLAALHMFRDFPLFGVGINNWLCHYSPNPVCYTPQLHHYWITIIPGTNQPTGVTDEPSLQPHNDILNVLVSIGIFGLLAYFATIALFYWLFARILIRVRIAVIEHGDLLQWMLIGVGTAFLAALVQGEVDSAFLTQDGAYFFWGLVASLLLLRVFTGTPWRGRVRQPASA